MIRFNVQSGLLTPVLSSDATGEEQEVANQIAQNFNSVTTGTTNYRRLLESLDQTFQSKNIRYQDYVGDQTISDIEGFYEKAAGIQPWDPTKQGAKLESFDAKFYAGLAPDKVTAWKEAAKEVTFGGKKIANLDVTKKYPTLDSYLHSDYTFVGAPSGIPGKPKSFDEYKETLRRPTNAEQQVLRNTLLGKSETRPSSLAELATQNYIDVQGERAFGALSADVLKQTLKEYEKALKQEQVRGTLKGMGLPSATDFKEDIKNSILGDLGAGGYLSFGKGADIQKSLSASLDKSLGMGASVSYNWQKWFDETLAARYQNMQEIRDPEDAQTTYKLEKQFVDDFVNDYLRPRFDTSKSISEFVSYMDVKEEEQNVLQTQLASSALKDFANKQAQTFINDLKYRTVTKEFDPDFYWNPELITGTDVTGKKNLYTEQKQNIEGAWEARDSDQPIKDGKTWKELAYEYGVDLNDRNSFARLHYQILGKDKGYDPVADTFNRKDLADYIQGDLAKALEGERASFGNPIFKEFVSAQSKAAEFVDKLNIKNLPTDLKNRLTELGINEEKDPADQVKAALTQILSTEPASKIREQIKQLNEQQIKPTQEKLGYGYIQRESDVETKAPTGGSKLFSIFKKAGYGGTEQEFYTDFFPNASEEDKNMTGQTITQATSKQGLQSLMGFDMPDFSDPFAAIGSISSMLDDEKTKKAETYKPKRSTYFDFFEDEEDAGAPSYFKMGSSTGFGSLFG